MIFGAHHARHQGAAYVYARSPGSVKNIVVSLRPKSANAIDLQLKDVVAAVKPQAAVHPDAVKTFRFGDTAQAAVQPAAVKPFKFGDAAQAALQPVAVNPFKFGDASQAAVQPAAVKPFKFGAALQPAAVKSFNFGDATQAAVQPVAVKSFKSGEAAHAAVQPEAVARDIAAVVVHVDKKVDGRENNSLLSLSLCCGPTEQETEVDSFVLPKGAAGDAFSGWIWLYNPKLKGPTVKLKLKGADGGRVGGQHTCCIGGLLRLFCYVCSTCIVMWRMTALTPNDMILPSLSSTTKCTKPHSRVLTFSSSSLTLPASTLSPGPEPQVRLRALHAFSFQQMSTLRCPSPLSGAAMSVFKHLALRVFAPARPGPVLPLSDMAGTATAVGKGVGFPAPAPSSSLPPLRAASCELRQQVAGMLFQDKKMSKLQHRCTPLPVWSTSK